MRTKLTHYLLFVFVIFYSFTGFAQLSGTKTIGGTSPDYATVSAAVTAMRTSGINGPIVFNIRQGTYTEHINLQQIAGASATNRITFQSDPANTSMPVIQYNATSSSTSVNYVWQIQGADYVTLKGLHLKALNSSYARVIHFDSYCDYIFVEDCKLEGSTLSTSSTNTAVIFNNTNFYDRVQWAEIKNNEIIGGSYGIYWVGHLNINYHENGNEISGNDIKDFYLRGIYSSYQYSLDINNNSITDRVGTTTSSHGILLQYVKNNSIIHGNKINMAAATARGIETYQCRTNVGSIFVKTYNNFIAMSGTASTGIHSYNCRSNQYNFNSIYMSGGSGQTGLYFYTATSGDVNEVRNNSVYTKSGTPVFYFSNTNPNNVTPVMDYNNFYTGGSNIVTVNTTNYTTLSAWNTAYSKDANSVSVDPGYYSTTDLHTNNSTLNAAGTPITGYTTDIDGETRNSTAPDIGADEFNTAAIDAGISYTSEDYCAGTDSVFATLRNNGTDTMTTVKIGWSVSQDGGSYSAQTGQTWTGTLLSGATTNIFLGMYTFPRDTVIKVKVFSYQPNNAVDSISGNDTLVTNGFKTTMSGVYTIGGTNASYATIAQAMSDLNAVGVCGPTTFHIRPGTYNERVTLVSYPGMSSSNRVTFKTDPAFSTQAVIAFNGYPLYFNGGNFITFENLDIKTNSGSWTVYLNANSEGLEFKNNKLTGFNTTSSSSSYAIIYTNSRAHQDLVITDNEFKYGSMAAYLRGSSGIVSSNIKFNDNTIEDFVLYGIYAQYLDEIEVDGNDINDRGAFSNAYGIYLSYCDALESIEGNKIVIESQYSGWGILLQYCYNTSTKRGLIYNNMISMLYPGSSYNSFGIDQLASNYQTTVFNSVYIKGTSGNSKAFQFSSGSQNSFYNNNAVVSGGYPIWTNSTISIPFSDNNNLYTTGIYKAYWSAYYTSISALASGTAKNSSSISVAVTFDGEDDLHTNTQALDGAGTPISGISTDFDGTPRNSTTPDIGADEFRLLKEDGGIFYINTQMCTGSNPVQMGLRNFGTTQLDSITVNWAVSVNGGSYTSQTPYKWQGSLAAATRDTISFGSYNFSKDSTYRILGYTSLPNNKLDSNTYNDSTISTSFKTALSGTYTIGGTNPDYASFGAALTDLYNFGICGPTTFEVRSGTYSETLSFGSIEGTNDTTWVTFKDASGNATSPILTSSTYPITFSGGEYIKIKGLTIRRTTSGYRVFFGQNTTNISLDSNRIEGFNSTSTSSGNSVIYGSNIQLQNIDIRNNNILYGGYSIFMDGITSNSSGVVIENNNIEDFSFLGLYLRDLPGVEIKNNDIEDRGSSSTVYSFQMILCSSAKVTGNEIINNSSYYAYGFYLDNCSGNASNRSMFDNNMISCPQTGSDYQYGIYQRYCNYITFAFNSINSRSSYNTRSYGIYHYYGSNVDVYNNNVIMNKGYAIYTVSSGAISNTDHNNLYTTGSYLAYWNGNRTTLTNYKSGSAKESNSISNNVTFVSNTDLHVANGGSALKSKGTPLSGITTDIDGDIRDNANPDIGADETAPIPHDAGIVSTKQIYCNGVNPYEVTIKNFGTDTLKSVTVNILVQTNGGSFVAETPFAWTGSLARGEDTTLQIGSRNFLASTTYAIAMYTSLPNGVADTATYNDTAFSLTSKPGLSGTYTVGGTSPDYATPQAALTAIKTANLCGPVVFNVRSGTYSGQMNMTAINGSSATNTITFKADPSASSKPIITNNSSTLFFNGISYITFEGLQITGSTGYAVYFATVGEGVELKDNVLQGYNINSTSLSYSVLYSATNADMGNVTISGNTIRNGSYGIYFPGNSGSRKVGLKVINNVFEDYAYYGSLIRYQDSLVFSGNEFEDKGYYTTVYSVGFNNCYNGMVVRNNYIHNLSRYGRGLNFEYCSGTGSLLNQVYNNQVVMNSTLTGSNSGIYLFYCNYLNIAFNSINSRSASSNAYGIYAYYGNEIRLYNNNVGTRYGYPLYTNSTSNIDFSNHNNWYSSNNSNVAYWAGNRTTIANLNSYSGKDGNSVDVAPGFFSVTDLHSNSSSLDSAGTPISGITEDFEGDTRNTSTPDIGADEFKILVNDAGVDSVNTLMCPGNTSIVAVITNYGTANLTSANVHWGLKRNAGSFTNEGTYNWTGTLSPGASAVVTIGTYNFGKDTTYTFKIYTSAPNSVADSANRNDTLVSSSFRTALTGAYTIGGTSPSYSTIQAAVSDLETYGVCGPVTFSLRSGTYNEQISISAFSGSSSTNRVTFQPDSANSSTVTWTSPNTAITFDGGNYITVKGLTVTSTSASDRIVFSRASTGIVLDGNTIIGYNSTSTSYRTINSYVQMTNCSIINNTITLGGYGIYVYGPTNPYGSNLVIENNEIKDFAFCGMYLRHLNGTEVNDNYLEDRSSNTSVHSIELVNGNIKSVSNNKIINKSRNYSYGIYLNNIINSNFNRGVVSNNMITTTFTNSVNSQGIYLRYCQYQSVVFNSINILSSYQFSYGINAFYGDQLSLFNNNVSTGRGYPLYTNSTTNVDFSNNNNLHSKTGSYVAYWSGNRTTISNLSSVSGKDGNSVDTDPKFVSNLDLHSTSLVLDSAGTPVSGVSTDFDGQTRNTTHPDIGADEFVILKNDAGIDSISSAICKGTYPVYVRLKNYGTSTLTSATINWKVKKGNGSFVAQTPYSWTGSIASESSAIVNIGSFTFNPDTLYDLEVYSTLPNSVADSNYANDTSAIVGFKTTMSGVYTVGGTNPSYTTIQAAINDLNTLGVCGPVTFHIRQGTYTGQNQFGTIQGASSTNIITFRADPSNTGQVVLTHSSYPIYFNSAKYVQVKNLTIQSTSTGYRVYYNGLCEGVVLDSNTITGYSINTSSSAYAAIFVLSNNHKDLEITNNTISNGSYGVYGNFNTLSTGVKISGNNISNFGHIGIWASSTREMEIDNNTISDRYSSLAKYGIYLSNTDNLKSISGNAITLTSWGTVYGMYLNGINNSSAQEGLITNNMINMSYTSSSTQYGVLAYNCTYLVMAHNTINSRSSSNGGAYGVWLRYGSFIEMYNNIIMMNRGWTIYSYYTTIISQSDYNLLYTGGSYFGYWASTRYSFAQYKSSSGKETNSINSSVAFKSATDLHLGANSQLAYDKGTPLTYVTTDIDGEIRDAYAPDLGADEVPPIQDDAGIAETKDLYCAGANPFEVRLRNFGSDTLKSATVHILVQANGGSYVAQPSYSWTGVLPPATDTLLKISSYTFIASSTYSVIAYTSSPNGKTDSASYNDTAKSITSKPGMSGTYSIGGTNPDFATPALAISNLTSTGLCGPVVFNIRQGTYTGQLNLTSVIGSSPTNTVTIQSDPANSSPAVITNSAWTVYFNGMSNVTVKDLTIQGTGTTNRVYLGTIGENTSIENCTITGLFVNSSSTGYSVVYGGSGANYGNLSITGNTITNGSYGIYLTGHSNNRPSGMEIEGNTISNFYYMGMRLEYQNDLLLKGNKVTTRNSTVTKYGVYLRYLNSVDEISYNEINCVSSSYTSYGIFMDNVRGPSNANRGMVYNNSVVNQSTSSVYDYGMYISYCYDLTIAFNSLNHRSSRWNSYAVYFFNGDGLYLYNNNIATRYGYPYFTGGTLNVDGSDNNNLYSSNGSYVANVASNYTSIAQLTAATGKDANSVDVAPGFSSITNLHTNATALNGEGTPISGITDDIDGDLRNASTPDIGFDEFSLHDAGVSSLVSTDSLCPTTDSVRVSIKNYGNLTMTSLTVDWYLKANSGSYVAQTSASWTGNLIKNADDTLTLGTFSFQPNTTYTLMAVSKNPNSSADGNKDNDTLISTIRSHALPGTNLSALSDVCVDASSFTLSAGTPSGGTYSGTGVSSGSFNPATAGVGTHSIIYSLTSIHGCSESDTAAQTVNALPSVSFGTLSAVCADRSAFALAGGSPASGTYSGNGVSSGQFDASNAGVGSHTITYTYTDGNGCSDSDTSVQVVNALPAVSLSLNPVCSNDGTVALSGGSPTGGTYSGTYVSTGSFNTSSSGAGTHAVIYTYTDGNTCTNADTTNLVVNAAPVVSMTGLTPICDNAGSFVLSGGSPAGGTFSGTAVSSGSFDPSSAGSGSYKITYSYTDSKNCTDTSSATQVVYASPNVSLSNLTPVCENAAPVNLSGGAPSGGSFSGLGVNSGFFDPATNGAGNYTITYTVTNSNSCTDSASKTQVVYAAPNVSLSVPTVCSDTISFALNGGTPTGGTYSGNGVSSGNFSASSAGSGNHQIVYSFTNSNNCTNNDTATLIVRQAPTVSFATLPYICADSASFALSGGSPSGGTYSGTGVSSGSFSAATAGTGSHTITYTFTNSNNCTANDTSVQLVRALPTVGFAALTSMCDYDNAKMLSGATPSGGVYSGTGVSLGSFDPGAAGAGTHSITYTYTDTYGCKNDTAQNQFVSAQPVVSLASIAALCDNSPSITLGGGTPAGGTFSGTGVSSGSFDPATAGSGSHQVIYTFSNTYGCSDSDTTSVTVNAAPTASLSSFNPVCIDTGLITLAGGSPSGGVYKGTGVSLGSFDPAVAGSGSHAITYVYTDGNNCMDSTSENYVVNALPTVALTLPSQLCLNTTLNLTGGTPSGGSYGGPNVLGTLFTPVSAGSDTVSYTYTDTNNCTNSSTRSLSVVAPPNVTFTSVPDVCVGSADSVLLSQGLPAGGSYKGSGVNGMSAKVDVGSVGTTTLWYTVVQGVCTDSASQTITVNALPNVSFTMQNVCDNEAPFEVSGGNPTGGTYIGSYIAGNWFYPVGGASGKDTVYYAYTDSNNCSDTVPYIIDLFVAPTAALILSPDSFCSADDSLQLSGGSPAGGLFFGDAVGSSGYFNPAQAQLGINTVTYVYVDANNCVDSAWANAVVHETPVFTFGADTAICDAQILTLSSGYGPNWNHEWNDGSSDTSKNVFFQGEFWLKVTNPDNPRCSASDTILVQYEPICVGIAESLAERVSISYYPNPSDGRLNARLEGFETLDVEVQVMNLQGQIVHADQWLNMEQYSTKTIDLSTSANGIYVIQLNTKLGSVQHRITINR